MRSLPYKTLAWLIAVWILLAIFNCLLRVFDVPTGVNVRHFPINKFSGPTLHIWGIPYALAFLIAVFLTRRFIQHFGVFRIWLVGLALIIVGNLGQGNVHDAFFEPFYEGDAQYYHDAVEIDDGVTWLADFNESQESLRIHSRTHPPFAVLVHYWLLDNSGGASWITATFVVFSSLSIILVWHIMRMCGSSERRASLFALLFVVIPAFNVYSAVCLDGVICTLFTAYLYGVVRIVNKTPDVVAVLCILVGGLLASLLTFAGTFLCALGVVVAGAEIALRRRWGLALVVGCALITQAIACILLSSLGHYDHIESFRVAATLENPDGFQAFTNVIGYLMTRVGGISEIALFLSLGCLATLFHADALKVDVFDLHNKNIAIFIAGLGALLMMLATGAFRVGETARVCLFIYPYLLLAFHRVSDITLADLITLAGLQTAAMQVLGDYRW